MTPATCPHCHENIDICPHCGLSLSEVNEAGEDVEGGEILDLEENLPPRVFLNQPKRNLPLGIGGTVFGVFGLIGGMFLIITDTLSGLLVLLLSALAIVGGSFMIIGAIVTPCPGCGKPLRLPPNVQNTTCPHCKTMCTRNGEYLEVIEI